MVSRTSVPIPLPHTFPGRRRPAPLYECTPATDPGMVAGPGPFEVPWARHDPEYRLAGVERAIDNLAPLGGSRPGVARLALPLSTDHRQRGPGSQGAAVSTCSQGFFLARASGGVLTAAWALSTRSPAHGGAPASGRTASHHALCIGPARLRRRRLHSPSARAASDRARRHRLRGAHSRHRGRAQGSGDLNELPRSWWPRQSPARRAPDARAVRWRSQGARPRDESTRRWAASGPASVRRARHRREGRATARSA